MRTPNPSDCADNILAANPDFNDDFLAGPTGGTDAVLSQSYGTTSGPGTPLETRSKESNGVGAKRRAAEIEDAGDDSAVMEERKRKIAKTGESEEPARSTHPFFTSKSTSPSTFFGGGDSTKSKVVKGKKSAKKGVKDSGAGADGDNSKGDGWATLGVRLSAGVRES
jgi:hypothetical protein